MRRAGPVDRDDFQVRTQNKRNQFVNRASPLDIIKPSIQNPGQNHLFFYYIIVTSLIRIFVFVLRPCNRPWVDEESLRFQAEKIVAQQNFSSRVLLPRKQARKSVAGATFPSLETRTRKLCCGSMLRERVA